MISLYYPLLFQYRLDTYLVSHNLYRVLFCSIILHVLYQGDARMTTTDVTLIAMLNHGVYARTLTAMGVNILNI